MKKLFKGLLALVGGSVVLAVGVAVVAVKTIDVDAEISRLEAAHATLAVDLGECGDDDACLGAMDAYVTSTQAPRSSLALAIRFAGDDIPVERLEALIAGGTIASCGDHELKRRSKLSAGAAAELCERYRSTWRELGRHGSRSGDRRASVDRGALE